MVYISLAWIVVVVLLIPFAQRAAPAVCDTVNPSAGPSRLLPWWTSGFV